MRQGHRQSAESIRKISESIRKAHAEGRMIGWKHINSDPNRMSKAERVFQKWLVQANLPYDIRIHFSIGKYFLDFAIIDLKIDVEIDGCQHFREGAQQYDRQRDDWLRSQGWRIYRISWSNFSRNKQPEFAEFLRFINDSHKNSDRFYKIIERTNRSRNQYQADRHSNYLLSQKQKIEEVRSANIDFSKSGWCRQVADILGISSQKVRKWLATNMPETEAFQRRALITPLPTKQLKE